jgi:uncharacterized protein (TIGR02594 family)
LILRDPGMTPIARPEWAASFILERSMDYPPWYSAAVKDLGLREAPGPVNNPRLLKLFVAAGFSWVKDERTPWCAIGLNAWLARVGIAGTLKPNARSFLAWGIRLDRPVPGCIVVLSRPPFPHQGHVGLYEGEDKTHIRLLGANQIDAVSRGWFPKSRLIRKDGRVVSWRWPKGAPLPGDSGPVTLVRSPGSSETRTG